MRLVDSAGTTPTSRLAALQQSAPTELKDKVRAAGARLDGERKPVTILFTDIVGSTSLAENLDPEEWKEVVSGVHSRVSQIVYCYEGTIAQLLGDGVLSFFGAPVTHEDDPLRAVRAALDIQESISEYSRSLAGSVDNLQMRIGIHTGLVVVGSVGSDLHLEYLAIGDAVNLAARLQSAAAPGTILLSEATARLVRPTANLNPLGEISLKGKREPVAVFQAVEIKGSPAIPHGVEGLSSPLVGRERELGLLGQALHQLKECHGQIVSIIGEAGIGKTRLVAEARGGDGGNVLRWLEGRSLSYGQTLSFWAIAQLIKADLGLADGDSEIRARVALRRRVQSLLGERAPQVLPYLAHLLSLKLEGDAAGQISSLEGETLKRQTLLALAAYFSAVADEQPTVLVFEDLHWADPSTLEALDSLLAETDRCPLLLLLLFRTETDKGCWQIRERAAREFRHRYTEIELTPLTHDQANSLIDNLLQVATFPEATRHLILERSEGNPFYLEELIRSLIEQGALVHGDGGWRATDQLGQVAIPETLQGILLARIDRLEDDVRRTLQLASVIGKSFLYRLLQAIAQAECALDKHLAALQRADLVREKARHPELEYMFKHSLTQEAAYDSLLIERRREFHRQVGEALEQLFPDRREEFYALLAHHFDAAGIRDKAVDYLVYAGDKARASDETTLAIHSYERAAALLAESDAPADIARDAQTWLKLGLVYHANFQFDLAHHANEKAFELQSRARQFQPALLPRTGSTQARNSLRVSQSIFPGMFTLDPSKLITCSEYEIVNQIFAGIATMDEEQNVLPHLARSWEVLDQGTRFVVHLRDDARWSDGTPVTAEDYEWTLKRTLFSRGHSYQAALLEPIAGARKLRGGVALEPDAVAVRAKDRWTLEVKLVEPVAYFPYLLAHSITYPIPRRAVEQWGDDWWRPEHIVSNGAFRLVDLQSDECIVERNPHYAGESKGNVDRVIYRRLQDAESAVELFRQDKLDLCEVLRCQVPPDLAEYKMEMASLGIGYLALSDSRRPTDDVRVRRALLLALDRAEIARKTGGPSAHGGMVPPGMAGHSPELGLPCEPEEARRLLAAAGYPGGEGFPSLRVVAIRPAMDAAQTMVRQWRQQLGIDVALRDLESLQDPAAWAPHAFFECWAADYPDPSSFLHDSLTNDAMFLGRWENARFHALVDEAARTSDRARRMAMYREADRMIVVDQALLAPVYYEVDIFCVLAKPQVRNLSVPSMNPISFKDIVLARP